MGCAGLRLLPDGSEKSAEVAWLGRTADATTAAAFTNDRVGVYDADASATTARTLLSGDGESMRVVGGLFVRLAGVLADAASAARAAVATMETEINDVIARRNALAAVPMTPMDREAADPGLRRRGGQPCAHRGRPGSGRDR